MFRDFGDIDEITATDQMLEMVLLLIFLMCIVALLFPPVLYDPGSKAERDYYEQKGIEAEAMRNLKKKRKNTPNAPR